MKLSKLTSRSYLAMISFLLLSVPFLLSSCSAVVSLPGIDDG